MKKLKLVPYSLKNLPKDEFAAISRILWLGRVIDEAQSKVEHLKEMDRGNAKDIGRLNRASDFRNYCVAEVHFLSNWLYDIAQERFDFLIAEAEEWEEAWILTEKRRCVDMFGLVIDHLEKPYKVLVSSLFNELKTTTRHKDVARVEARAKALARSLKHDLVPNIHKKLYVLGIDFYIAFLVACDVKRRLMETLPCKDDFTKRNIEINENMARAASERCSLANSQEEAVVIS